jgi:hypothetical protein
LEPLMSRGYEQASEGPRSFEDIEVAPAGGMSTSAADITHFMIAELSAGRWGDAQILSPATLDAMHTRQPGWPPAALGAALGFYESSRNGHRIIGHGGDTEYFHSGLYLIDDAGVGFFVSCNSAGNGRVTPSDVVFDRFMARYFPDHAASPSHLGTALADARAVAGVYMSSRRAQTNVRAVTSMLNESTIAADLKDSAIVISGVKGLNGQQTHFHEVAPQVFRETDGPAQVTFVKDTTGRLTAFMDFPFEVLQRVDDVSDRKDANLLVLALSLGSMVLTLLGWPVAAMVRTHYGRPQPLDARTQRRQMLVRVVCLLDLAFVVLGALAVGHLGLADAGGLGPGTQIKLHALQGLGFVGVVGALFVLYSALRSWGNGQVWVWSKVWNTWVALACVAFSWFLVHWHSLNVTLHY